MLAHIPNTVDPLQAPAPWYVLMEIAIAGDFPLKDTVENALAKALEGGLVNDATIAANDTQRRALWHLRESLSEAQKYEGASIKHDVSVPVERIPAFIERGIAAVAALIPGVRPVPFGHLGDGNIHFNFSVPIGGNNEAFLARWQDVSRVVHDLVHDFDGSISAEHGLGVMKRDEVLRYKSAAEMELMRALKHTLDPADILNPGKVV